MGKDIKVAIFNNRLEITSPGTLPPSIDLMELPIGQSEIRNRVLAAIFKDLGLIEQWGTVFKKIKEVPRDCHKITWLFKIIFVYSCHANHGKYKKRYELLKPIMNERLRRLWSAAEAKVIGQGGIGLVAQATGQSRTTIASGIKELAVADKQAMTGVRKAGSGRQKIIAKTPAVEAELLQLIEPTVSAKPESPLLWTTKSLRTISAEKMWGFYDID